MKNLYEILSNKAEPETVDKVFIYLNNYVKINKIKKVDIANKLNIDRTMGTKLFVPNNMGIYRFFELLDALDLNFKIEPKKSANGTND